MLSQCTINRWVFILLALASGCSTPVFMEWSPEPAAAPAPDRIWRRNRMMPEVPKSRLVASSSGMVFAATEASTEQEDTNTYTYYPLGWNHQGPVDSFRLYYGTTPGRYTSVIDVGPLNRYEFSKTNWIEEGLRHFFAVTAVYLGLESDYSKELPLPPYPPTHFRLMWSNPEPMTIIAHTNISVRRDLWPVMTQTSSGQTNFQQRFPEYPSIFFQSYRTSGPPEVLRMEAFNPMND